MCSIVGWRLAVPVTSSPWSTSCCCTLDVCPEYQTAVAPDSLSDAGSSGRWEGFRGRSVAVLASLRYDPTRKTELASIAMAPIRQMRMTWPGELSGGQQLPASSNAPFSAHRPFLHLSGAWDVLRLLRRVHGQMSPSV
nr:hypothetical protein CFP56_19685 [Quercus suber]